jgi:hypothetical protein
MKAILRAAAFALLLGGAAGAAHAAGAPKTLVIREGLTGEQLDADGKVCLKEAKAAERGRPMAPLPTTGGAAGRMAGAAAAGAMKGWSDVKRFLAAHDACLDRLGYRQVALTPEQRAEYKQLKTSAERRDYIVEFSRRAIADGK